MFAGGVISAPLLCAGRAKVAWWNRGCGFAERFQQVALFNCKEFDYSERSRFRTFRLFCWTKITYLLDEINIYYMDPVTFSMICLNMTRVYHLDRLDIYIMLNHVRTKLFLLNHVCIIYYMDPVTFSTIYLNMTRAYHLDRLDIYILLHEIIFAEPRDG